MRRKLFCSLALLLATAGVPWLLASHAWGQESFVAEEGVETLTRGPLHEAFAEPVTFETTQTLIIQREPPAPIDELPPEYRPDDEDAIWIPGYWSWDEDREDFVWLSGVWRVPPPGQRWVPGYWQTVSEGYEWVPGFWVSAEVEELSYSEPPPESLETGPVSPAPDDDHFYVPGIWQYTTVGYRWQPGYWHPGYENWMWIPARWCWTPRGVVFVNGYWDYRLPQRGMVFAPVYLTRTVYSQPRFFYRPSVVININIVFNNLFVRPGYRHYYYGDWYGDRYARYNIMPAYQWHSRRGGYDPVVSYYSSIYRRRGEDFIALSRAHYVNFERNPNLRPARTFTEMSRRIDRIGNELDRTRARQDVIASRLNDVVRERRRDDLSFVKVEDRQVEQIRERSREVREFTRQRSELERLVDNKRGDRSRGDRVERGPVAAEGARLKLPKVADTRPADRPAGTRPSRAGRDDVPRPIVGKERGDRETPSVAGPPDRTERPDRPERPDPTARDPRTGRPNVAQQPDQIDRPRSTTLPDRDRSDRPDLGRRPNPSDVTRDPRTRPNATPGKDAPDVTELPRTGQPRLERPQATPDIDPRSPRPGASGDAAARRAEALQEQLRRAGRPSPTDRNPATSRDPRLDRPSSDRPNPATERLLRDPRTIERPGKSTLPAPGDRGRSERPQDRPERRALRPEVPNLGRPAATSRPQPQPNVTRPQPKVERPQPQPRVERPQPQPRVERPQPQPKVERPQPQPRAERPQPQGGGGGGKPDRERGKRPDKEKKD